VVVSPTMGHWGTCPPSTFWSEIFAGRGMAHFLGDLGGRGRVWPLDEGIGGSGVQMDCEVARCEWDD
jgi:hypothetical protein